MSLALTNNPNEVIDRIDSNVSAAISQLPYAFLRSDNGFDRVNDSVSTPGKIRILDGLTTDMSVGDTVYFRYLETVYKSQLTTILVIDTANTMTLDIDYISDQGPTTDLVVINRISERPDYAVLIKIILDDPLTNPVEDQLFFFIPNHPGNLFVDLGDLVGSIMENNDVFSMNYHIDFAESFTGNTPSFTSDIIIQAILGERGIGQIGSANLWDDLLRRGITRLPSLVRLPELDPAITAGTSWFFRNGRWELGNTIANPSRSAGIGLTRDLVAGTFTLKIKYVLETTGGDGNLTLGQIVDGSSIASPIIASNVNTAQFDFVVVTPSESNFGIDLRPTVPQGTVTKFYLTSFDLSDFYQGRFITHFDQLRYWVGWSTGISWIMDKEYVNRESPDGTSVEFTEIQTDINGGLITIPDFDRINDSVSTPGKIRILDGLTFSLTAGDTVNFEYSGAVYTSQRTLILAIDSSTSMTLDIDHISDEGPTPGLVEIGIIRQYSFPNTPASIQEQIIQHEFETESSKLSFVLFNDDLSLAMAQIEATVTPECANPIMVQWANSSGAKEYYLFDISQEVRYGSIDELTFQTPVEEPIENITRQKTSINADQSLTLFCTAENILQSNIRALHEIKTSEDVQVFLIKDGTKKVGVIVSSAFATGYDTDDHTTDFTVGLEFPTDYNFFTIKEY